jgi:pyruvate dehydrogenase (quinone)/pyruvate decarboxylase
MDRREFLLLTETLGLSARTLAFTPWPVAGAGRHPQPGPVPAHDQTTADILVDTLNSVIEALRRRQDRICYIGVRHEEAAAFMASGIAKHTGRLGVCLGTTGPGAIHLMNGLYDAAFDGVADVRRLHAAKVNRIATQLRGRASTDPVVLHKRAVSHDLSARGRALTKRVLNGPREAIHRTAASLAPKGDHHACHRLQGAEQGCRRAGAGAPDRESHRRHHPGHVRRNLRQ